MEDFSHINTFLERSFCVFAIFAEFSLSEPVLERSFCVFAISVVRFCVNFWFRGDFRAFADFRCPFHALSTRSFCVFAISEVSDPSIFLSFDDFRDFC